MFNRIRIFSLRALAGHRPVRLALVVVVATALLPLSAISPNGGLAQGTPLSREVLALYDGSEARPGSELLATRTNLIHSLAEMPINHLGLQVRYLDVNREPLPSEDQMRRYLGVISWFGDDRLANAAQYLRWLQEQVQGGRRVVVLGHIGAYVDGTTGAEVPPDAVDAALATLGLRHEARSGGYFTDNPLLISVRRKVPEMVEFERTLEGELFSYEQFQSVLPGNRVHLTVTRTDLTDGDSDVVVTGPWGGFALSGYDYYEQPRTFQKRWRINPFAFFEEAFGVRGHPRPDVSTLNGSRVFYTHIDGDGFNNVSELDFVSLSAEVLLQRFVRRYRLPFSLSIVVHDIDPAVFGGEHQLQVARQIFAQANVEPASHTYSHPFDWTQPLELEHETREAVEFLNQRVAPADRPVKLILWSGATNPSEAAVARTVELGLLNINGGDGRFDSLHNSYTALAPLSTQVGRFTQFYTSNANDNIYGNDWTGPYYGLRNVIETWEKTESPRRIGAMNVYYHIFTAEKHASVKALEDVYDYALSRDIAPVFTTEYIQTVEGFFAAQIVQEAPDTWRMSNYGALHTVRFDDEARAVDLRRSENVIGYSHYQGALYIYLGDAPVARIALSTDRPQAPYLLRASHRIADWRAEQESIAFSVHGVGRKSLAIANLRPGAEFEIMEAGPAQQAFRLAADAQGTLSWASAFDGSIQVTVRGARS